MTDNFYHFRRWRLGIKLDLAELKNLKEEIKNSEAFAKEIIEIDKQIQELEG
jgi:hypothetical protein